ncbi:class I SAM-dependent methyltransferase [Eubacterium sp. MSJ-13]|uniref:class I SAM-dependent methyltransferase n=1 Tax=Eubacterium sp. MSJ-13 TaxID=2841513 RepID=UPI001C12194B|nr:class I SAM-dependent methyltransferase [Eubacterium sp. MSJ-13]MBU5477606.1 class I SAM-dependent methyltransferase [Eubacterium sp. MSJ-13]
MIKDNKILKTILYKIYKFDEWHLIPLEDRKYVSDVVNTINKKDDIRTVLEIGCGLGDIVRNVYGKKCVGYDVSESVISAARLLSHRTKFFVGTFDKIFHKKIDCLITVNFIHGIPTEELREIYKEFFINNRVKYLVLDTVVSKKYSFNHKLEELLDDNWEIDKKIGKYQADMGTRNVYIMKNKKYLNYN